MKMEPGRITRTGITPRRAIITMGEITIIIMMDMDRLMRRIITMSTNTAITPGKIYAALLKAPP
jgi:hypothetical protein